MGTFEEPWAMAFEPGTGRLFITEKRGALKFLAPDGTIGTVSGVPEISYGGQGGFGDIAFAPDYTTSRRIYLSWVEAGDENTRGAVLGRGNLSCSDNNQCSIEGLDVIWRQVPKVTGGAHFAHRIAFSPDGEHLFLSSGDRAKADPAQDLDNNLGKVLRLNLDGTPAAGNPFADQGSPADEIWSYGHRNILGLSFDRQGGLWALEHGPAGGDEFNYVRRGENYGWPVVSDGDNYDGSPLPPHSTRPEFVTPAISWNPVIAPGNFIFYSGSLFPDWRGEALMTGLRPQILVRVKVDGDQAHEVKRYSFSTRLRDIVQGPDGALWIVGDGPAGQLMKLTPAE